VVSSPFKFANPSSNEDEFREARWCEEYKRACNPACIFSIARARSTLTPTPTPPLFRERQREREKTFRFFYIFRACFVQKLEILKREERR
jgi:hypothetical protein